MNNQRVPYFMSWTCPNCKKAFFDKDIHHHGPDCKKPLIETNPYLRDPIERKEMIHRAVLTSTAIEGVHTNKRKGYKDIDYDKQD